MATNAKKTWFEKVMAIFAGGDEANVKAFHREIVKSWNRKVEVSKRNISTLKTMLEDKLYDLKQELEEANDVLENAYIHLDAERIKDLNSRKLYQTDFEALISNCTAKVESLEAQIKAAKEDTSASIQKEEKAIEAYTKQIAKLS
jgi:hypothetical protein